MKARVKTLILHRFIIFIMDTRKKLHFPPLRKNYFRRGNVSVQPTQKEIFKLQNHHSKYGISLILKVPHERDLTVSPRYLQYHKNIVHMSKVSLIEDFKSFKTPHKTPLNLVKLSDYELENWRLNL